MHNKVNKKTETINGYLHDYFVNNQGKKQLIERVYYKNRLVEIVHFLDGIKHGEYKLFYDTSEKKLVCNYKNNKLDGEIEIFYKNGRTKEKASFKNGIQIGEYFEYFESGKVKQTSTYKDDKKIGESKYFYETGELKMVCDSENQ